MREEDYNLKDEDYLKSLDNRVRMLHDALTEFEIYFGEDRPISISLLLLDLGIDWETKGKLIFAYKKLAKEKDFSEMEESEIYKIFRKETEKYFKDAKNFSDKTMYRIIFGFSRILVPELYELAISL